MKKEIIILVGGSGSGKNTLADGLGKYNIPRIITTTTRKPRAKEVQGVHYYFASEEEFSTLEKIEETVYAGNRYGITKAEIDKKLALYNKVCIITDKRGISNLRAVYGDMVTVVFIYVPKEDLKNRMIQRGDSTASIEERMTHYDNEDEGVAPKGADIIIENQDSGISLFSLLKMLNISENVSLEDEGFLDVV